MPWRITPALFKRQEVGLLGAVLVLGLFFTILNDRFLAISNIYNVLANVAVVGIMAVGEAFVLLIAEIDLSVGAVLGLAGIIAGWLMGQGVMPWIAIILAVAAGAVVGLIQGGIIVYGRVNSFIVTLGMLSVATGLTELITGGLPAQTPNSMLFLGQGQLPGGIPVSVVIFIALVLIGQFVRSRSIFGIRVIAVGDNREAARLSGMPVNRTRILVFVLCGALAAFAGIVYMAQVGVAETQAGNGIELDVIAAGVIGGVSLFGGRGSIVGALFGACLLGMLENAFVLLALSSFLQQLATGVVIILAVLFDQFRQGSGHTTGPSFWRSWLRGDKRAPGSFPPSATSTTMEVDNDETAKLPQG